MLLDWDHLEYPENLTLLRFIALVTSAKSLFLRKVTSSQVPEIRKHLQDGHLLGPFYHTWQDTFLREFFEERYIFQNWPDYAVITNALKISIAYENKTLFLNHVSSKFDFCSALHHLLSRTQRDKASFIWNIARDQDRVKREMLSHQTLLPRNDTHHSPTLLAEASHMVCGIPPP